MSMGLFVYFGWLDPIFFLYVSSLRWPDGFKAMDCAEISGAVGSTAEAGSDWTDGAAVFRPRGKRLPSARMAALHADWKQASEEVE